MPKKEIVYLILDFETERVYIGLRGIVNFYVSLNGFACTGADGIAGISSPATSMKQLSRKQVSGLLIPISLTLLTFFIYFGMYVSLIRRSLGFADLLNL